MAIVCVINQLSQVISHVSHVHVTYHISLMPTATDPHPAKSPTLYSKQICKDPRPLGFERNKGKVLIHWGIEG